MNPSRYQLPQYVSQDRRNAREDTLRRMRERYAFAPDVPLRETREGEYRSLPPLCRNLPPEAQFPKAKLMEFLSYKATLKINKLMVNTISRLTSPKQGRRYQAVFRVVDGPTAIMNRWREDVEFARQRLSGVNPMHIRRVFPDGPKRPSPALWSAAEAQLRKAGSKLDLNTLCNEGKLFEVDYSLLWNAQVQGRLLPASAHRRRLAAPTCLFYTDERGTLLPLAIQLVPDPDSQPGGAKNKVFTPSSDHYDWMMARCHVGVADTHLHEGVYHLLETHLVSGAIALCTYRRLHPDHPLRQLLEPHYEYTLAINKAAELTLINPGGAIDRALTAGVAGTFEAMRLWYGSWSFKKRSLHQDLADRGVGEPGTLPHYYYRDDSLKVHRALRHYVESLLGLWYLENKDVECDPELQAWAKEIRSPQHGNIPDFPVPKTREELFDTVTELIFRAGPQHAAVNNGQFDAYGFVPNMPGRVEGELPGFDDANSYWRAANTPERERRFWASLPDEQTTTAQMNMVWVLSAQTVRTLLHSGESAAFHPLLCPEADEIIGGFRRQLSAISDAIERRNERLDVPYRYLDPKNISRSTDI